MKIVNAPRGVVESSNDKFEVFYIDYGNQEAVTFSQLRPIDPSVSSAPGLAQLCSLAYLKVPNLEDDYGQEAAFRLSEHLLSSPKEFKAIIEERDTSGGKVKGQGTGTIFMVTLVDPEADVSINATMLQVRTYIFSCGIFLSTLLFKLVSCTVTNYISIPTSFQYMVYPNRWSTDIARYYLFNRLPWKLIIGLYNGCG